MFIPFFKKYRRQFQRALEILPGALAWTIILFPLWGTFFVPKIVAYFVLAFDVYWLYRSFSTGVLGTVGFLKIKELAKVNWMDKYSEESGDLKKWGKPLHAVVIVCYKEPAYMIRRCVESLDKQSIDKSQLAVVIAMEARATDAKERAEEGLKDYAGRFGDIFATYHPADLVGEVVGKAANEFWATRIVKEKFVDSGRFSLSDLTITSCDVDSVFDKNYFAALNYKFLTNESRFLRIWQSPIFQFNNLWRVPGFVRIISIVGNMNQLATLQDTAGLVFNYSTYSLSLRLLDEVGYWDRDVIPEDWHLFLKSFFAKKGLVEVEPIFLPTYQDAAESTTYVKTMVNRYEQCKRTAWGAVDIPYAIINFFKHKEIPLRIRIPRVYKLVESHIIWSTGAFILAFGASIPPLLNPVFAQTVLGQTLPKLSSFILTLCLTNLLVIIFLNHRLQPKNPEDTSKVKQLLRLLEWPFLPIASFLVSSVPGLDAQTRLMLGKYMEYRVTEKV